MSKKAEIEVELEQGDFFDMKKYIYQIERKNLLFESGEKLCLWHLVDLLK